MQKQNYFNENTQKKNSFPGGKKKKEAWLRSECNFTEYEYSVKFHFCLFPPNVFNAECISEYIYVTNGNWKYFIPYENTI